MQRTPNIYLAFDVIVCGSLHLDIVVRSPSIPLNDETVVGSAWQQVCGGRVLVLQNEVPHAVNVAAAVAPKASGAAVVFNAAPACDVGSDRLDLVDVLVVNRVEAEGMSGLAVHDRASVIAALPALQKFAKSIVVTLGGDGLVLSELGGTIEIEAQRVKVISTHGVEDCLCRRQETAVSLYGCLDVG